MRQNIVLLRGEKKAKNEERREKKEEKRAKAAT